MHALRRLSSSLKRKSMMRGDEKSGDDKSVQQQQQQQPTQKQQQQPTTSTPTLTTTTTTTTTTPSTALPLHGIKLSYLKSLTPEHGHKNIYEFKSTYVVNVCTLETCPHAQAKQKAHGSDGSSLLDWKCSVAQHLARDDKTKTNVKTVADSFVSYAWLYTLNEVVDALLSGDPNENRYVWIDCLTLPQVDGFAPPPPTQPSSTEDAAAKETADREAYMLRFRTALATTHTAEVILIPWTLPVPSKRSWCVYEQFCMAEDGIRVQYRTTPKEAADFQQTLRAGKFDVNVAEKVYSGVDVMGAQAGSPADKKAIDNIVMQPSVGIPKVNKIVMTGIRNWFASVSSTLLQQQTLSPLERGRITIGVANLHYAAGDFNRALKEFDEGIRVLSNLQDASCPAKDMLDAKQNRAQTLVKLGRNAEALVVFKEQLLDKYKELLGPTHPAVFTCMNCIGAICQQIGKYEEALDMEEASLAQFADAGKLAELTAMLKIHSLTSPECQGLREYLESRSRYLNGCAMMYSMPADFVAKAGSSRFEGRHQDALKMIDEAIDIANCVFGVHMTTATLMINKSHILKNTGAPATDVLTTAKEALAMYRRIANEYNPIIAEALQIVAMAQMAIGGTKELHHAWANLQHAIQIQRVAYGTDWHPNSINTFMFMAQCSQALGEAKGLGHQAGVEELLHCIDSARRHYVGAVKVYGREHFRTKAAEEYLNGMEAALSVPMANMPARRKADVAEVVDLAKLEDWVNRETLWKFRIMGFVESDPEPKNSRRKCGVGKPHTLTRSMMVANAENVWCNCCHKNLPRNEALMTCRACKYNVCKECFGDGWMSDDSDDEGDDVLVVGGDVTSGGKAAIAPGATQRWCGTKGHNLARTVPKTNRVCDVCKTTQIPAGKGVTMSCDKCCYDVCVACYYMEKDASRHKCGWPGHVLERLVVDPKGRGKRCNYCQNPVRRGGVDLTCSACDYDLCETCFADSWLSGDDGDDVYDEDQDKYSVGGDQESPTTTTSANRSATSCGTPEHAQLLVRTLITSDTFTCGYCKEKRQGSCVAMGCRPCGYRVCLECFNKCD